LTFLGAERSVNCNIPKNTQKKGQKCPKKGDFLGVYKRAGKREIWVFLVFF
jgi:hypothetical protein